MLYKKLDKNSLEAMPDGLSDLFNMPPTDVAFQRAHEREFMTLNPHTQAPFNFKIVTGTQYMDPRSVRLVTKFKIMKTKDKVDSVLDEDDDINVVNGLGSNYIRNLRVNMGGQTVFDSNNLYSWKADFDNLLNFSEDAKRSSMNVFGWYNDTKGKSKQYTKGAQEESWKTRRALFLGGKEVEMMAPLYADVFQQSSLIPSNMEIDIQIYPQNSEYMIYAPNTAKAAPKVFDKVEVTITSVRLYATFYDLHPGVALEIEKKLASGEPFKYAMRRTEMKVMHYDYQKIIANSQIFSEIIPRKLTLGFISKDAYDGTYDTDPHAYNSYKLRNIEVHAGNLRVPFVPFEMDFPNNHYIRGFEHLHRTLGLTGSNIDCGINREMFADGYNLWVFNLTSSLQDDATFDFVRDGPTMLNLRFEEMLASKGIYAIIMAQWDSVMYIDHTRTVRTDLTA